MNVNQKRYAVASALAATAVPALVMARGHRVEEVPELPLVVDTSLETCTKTAAALATLTALGAAAEVEKVRSETQGGGASNRGMKRGRGSWDIRARIIFDQNVTGLVSVVVLRVWYVRV